MTLLGYVLRDLLRNPRRTLTSVVGVIVGVGLFSAVLFFIDGSGASMTRRAIAPLALDMQLVLTAPLGGGIRLEQAIPAGALDRGDSTVVTLTITNDGLAAAHEVVVRDYPPTPHSYVPGSTTLDDAPVEDADGSIPLHQGMAGIGLNLGTLEPGATRRISYVLRAAESVRSTADLLGNASISSREAITPAAANAPPAESLMTLAERVATVPGVQAANALVLADLEDGALTANGTSVPGHVKLLAFDERYQSNYPSLKIVSGGMDPSGTLISAETARALQVSEGDIVTIVLPGGAEPLPLVVSGIADLSAAKPLFESRESSRLEEFLYVPFTAIVGHDVYRDHVEPAFEAAVAARGTAINSVPLEELDILLDRAPLNADPSTAVKETRTIASAVLTAASDEDYVIDNISNTLEVAEGDAAVAKRLFVFLGLPGAILAAVLTAYAGALLAEAQRRENALLRVRGANKRHLLSLLALRTIAIAGIGSLIGVALGYVSVLFVLGQTALAEASISALLQSAAIGVLGGMLVTALALYLPGRRLITSEIKQEIAVIPRRRAPLWRRLHLDLVVLLLAGVAQLVALQLGAFDVPPGSVYAGRSVSLPLHLLIAPILVWISGTVFLAYVVHEVTQRVASTRHPTQFGPLLTGVLWRSVTRRIAAITAGVLTLGLVVGLGTMLTSFATVYERAAGTDARFLVASDLRITPNPTSAVGHPIQLEQEFSVDGASGSTAVVFSVENSVLTSEFNEDVASLAAVDPTAYADIAALRDSIFVDGSASRAMASLAEHPDGILVNSALAEGLKLAVGDSAKVMLARGTDQQVRRDTTVLGLFTQFPGAPEGTDIVANIDFYSSETGLSEADYYLVKTTDRSPAALDKVRKALSSIGGFAERFDVQTSAEALDKDKSSLTALNLRDLLHLDSLFTFLMAATATAMFVFGLLMQRRREYVTMRAQGVRLREICALVLAESGLSAILGTVIGLLIGVVMASQFVHVLRPIFTLAPPLEVPIAELSVLVALVLGATALSAIVASVLISRLKPTELLRDE